MRTIVPVALLVLAAGIFAAPVPRSKTGMTIVDDRAWKHVELVAFRDFDNVDVKLEGTRRRAYLVGLRPLGKGNKEGRARIIKEVSLVLAKSPLYAQVVTRRNGVIGLSIDLFRHHHKPGFDKEWNPHRYGFCATGWGAYNLNVYFLKMKYTKFEDNFASLPSWRRTFDKISGEGK